MEKEKVYVTVITHKHGINLYVNRTREGAYKEVEWYVSDNWKSEMPDDVKLNKETAVEDYFGEMSKGLCNTEFYDIDGCEVGE